MEHTDSHDPRIARIRRAAILFAIAGWLILILGGFMSGGGGKQFFQSYLYAFLFWNGLSLGCLSLIMLHHLVAGRWGFMVQRIAEAGAKNLLVMAVLFVPILLFGLWTIYPWAPGGALADSELVQSKAAYLNTRGWMLRACLYYAIWIGLMLFFTRTSLAQDRSGDPALTVRMNKAAGPGLVAYVLTVTFMATDWAMSLEPEWFSTIYGPLFIVCHGLTTLAFCIVMLNVVADRKPHADVMSVDYFHHLGSLTCGFVVLWAYMSFSQYLIIWSGNLAEEVAWYKARSGNTLEGVAVILMVFHFALPLFILLQRRVKRARRALVGMAFWIFAIRTVDLYWIIIPAFHPGVLGFNVMDAAAMFGIGGLWMAVFTWNLQRHPLLPLHDQRMQEALGLNGHGHHEALEHA